MYINTSIKMGSGCTCLQERYQTNVYDVFLLLWGYDGVGTGVNWYMNTNTDKSIIITGGMRELSWRRLL